MTDFSIERDPGEPLAAWFSAERAHAGVREQRFECASGGDLVSGHRWLPAAPARALVLAAHELGRNTHDAALAEAAASWAARGIATAAIDLPLHGERHNAKLSPRAIAAASAGPAHADAALWRGLVAQAVRDLARALDALETRGALPEVTCVAFGSSAPLAFALANLDARVARASAIGAPRGLALDPAIQALKPFTWLARPDDLTFAS